MTMTLGQVLKDARMQVGLTQREVSEHLGYSTPQFVSNWERDVSKPPIKAIRKLAKLYKVDAEAMLRDVKLSWTEDLNRRINREWLR